MKDLYLEIIVMIILIILNGFLSMSEIAVISARKVRLQQRARSGSPGARAALELAAAPNHFLSTVQIGITLISILLGAFGGATIARELDLFFSDLPVPWLANYSEAAGVALVVLAVTFLSLILGELAPKQIGLINPERIAARVAPFMQLLARITAPFVHFLSFSTKIVLRLLRIEPTSEPEVTEDEIKMLVRQAAKGGILEPEEKEMVEQVFRLADRLVSSQMTPRPDIVWLDLEESIETVRATLREARFSYYPVGRGHIDNLVGIVRVKDLLAEAVESGDFDIESKMQPPLYIPESLTMLESFASFRENRTRVALIIDEFGGIRGLTTITDILEAIAGDFPEGLLSPEPEILRREDGTYLLDGMLDIDAFMDLLDLHAPPGADENYYQTLGGFIMTYLGRIPNAGDAFVYEHVRIEIVDMDGLRVDKVLVTPTPVARSQAQV